MKSVFIYETSCPRRRLDADRIKNYFLKNNYSIVKKPINADIIILITCGFVEEAEEDSINTINYFKRFTSEIIVLGCLPLINSKRLSEVFNGKKLGTKNLEKIDDFFPENKVKFGDIEDSNIRFVNYWEKNLSKKLKLYFLNRIKERSIFNIFSDNSKSFFIRISNGCISNCSYCAIKKATGEHKSKTIEECIKEFKKGLSEGYKNFSVSGESVGPYGLDNKTSLPRLLDKITNIPGEYEIELRNLNPKWFIKYFEDFKKIFKKQKIVTIHLSVQSGNSRILKLMNRYSNIKEIKEKIIEFRKLFPNVIINSEFIAGFPSETYDEFKETLFFIKETDLPMGVIYPFSLRKGTKSEDIEPKISKSEISGRLKEARAFLKNEGYKVVFVYKSNFVGFAKKRMINNE